MIKNYKYIVLVIVVLMLVIGCGSSKPGNENVSLAEKEFRSNCQSCHILPKPFIKTDAQWPEVVAQYGEKAKLSEEQINQIISYLTENN